MKPPVRQSDSGDAALRAHGCTIASLAYLAGWATNGDALPDSQAGRDDLMNKLQRLSGVTRGQFLARGTSLTEAEIAFESLPFPGRLPPRMRLMRGASVRDDLMPELRAGRLAVVAVNYGAVQDAGKGVGSFRGGHAVVVGEPPDANSVSVADPLRAEVVRWPLDLLVKAMETFGAKPWGNGRGEAGVVYPSPTWQQAYTDAKAGLAAANKALDKASQAVADQKQQTQLAADERDQARRDLAACKATTPTDCTVDVNTERGRVLDAITAGVGELVAGLR